MHILTISSPARRLGLRPLLGALLVLAVLLATVSLGATARVAAAQDGAEPDDIVVVDGQTQPVFSYADALREVVQVTSPVSSHDGPEPDIITVDIIRPAASEGDLRVPTIMIPSPYYSGPGRGGTANRSGERKPTPPARPSIVAGEAHYSGNLMSSSLPLTGQAGRLVNCGLAETPEDCPEGSEGAIALIERAEDAAAGNLATSAAVSCSYTSPWESCSVLNSGTEPPNSNPPSGRWGTWPNGGAHWLQLTWSEPQTVSVSDVYWFQDSADGSNSGVKRPAQWSLQYWDGAGWQDVANPSGYGTALNQFNRTTFDAVTTTQLRANLQTRSDALGVGALEWQVYTTEPVEGPDQVGNAVVAGAVGAVVYNNVDGSFTGALQPGTPIPALAISREDGLALVDALAAGDVDANLRELVDPINFFPLYYDNVFVPRGYAVALVDLAGSRYSTGCLDVGGPAEADGAVAVVEWLAGNRPAVSGTTGQPVVAEWSNGKVAMIGKSWDGTIPIAAAARAPEGLATIVPIAGLSEWHSDFWDNGTRYGGSPTQWHDGNSNNPSMTGRCTQTRAHLAANQNNPDPNSDFWQERNWTKDVGDFETSVFIVHGMNDYNVKPVNFGRLWAQLARHDVPRKMWLSQVAHEKAFDFRRHDWIVTIGRWFDYWLHGIDNGIMDEPKADVEHLPDQWTAYAAWPNGSRASHLWFGRSQDPDDPRLYTLTPDARDSEPEPTATFFEIRRNLTQLAQNQFSEDTDGIGRVRRLAFLSEPLSKPVHVSGETKVTLEVRISGANAQNTTFSALLVDYGTAPRRQHTTTGGVVGAPGTTCFGDGTAADTGCYPNIQARVHTPVREIVSRGWAQIGFHLGVTQIDPDETYRLTWGLQHHDYVFAEGHRIGLIIAGPETHLHNSRHPTSNRPVEVQLGPSRVQLPVVGGPPALRDALR